MRDRISKRISRDIYYIRDINGFAFNCVKLVFDPLATNKNSGSQR